MDIESRLQGISGNLAASLHRQESAAVAAGAERVAWIVGVVLVALLTGLVILIAMQRAARLKRMNDLRDLACLPLQKLIIAHRDTTAALIQRLHGHGHENTEVYLLLQKLLPVLERESGRASLKVADLTNGRVLADVGHDMVTRPLVLGKSDAGAVHQAALQDALAAQHRPVERLAA